MTVTNVVNILIEGGWICECDVDVNLQVGRNPIVLSVAGTKKRILGVYISRDGVTFSSIGFDAKIDRFEFHAYRDLSGNFILGDALALVVDFFISMKSEGVEFVGVGVACIGPLDSEHGVILNPPDFFPKPRSI